MVFEMIGFATLQMNRSQLSMCFVLIFPWILQIAPSLDCLAQSANEATLVDASTVYDSCLVCHSTREMQRGPILDGLPSWYVLGQFKKFSEGIRGINNENKSELLMAPVVQQYSDPEIWKKIAHQIESSPAPNHVKTIRGDHDKGRVLFAVCSSCHGSRGQGNPELKAPPLNVQEDWYLMDQLRKFQIGMRGYDSRDVEGKLMQSIARMYSVKDLKDIVAFISHNKESNREVGQD